MASSDLSAMGHHAGKHTAAEGSVVEGLCRAFEQSALPLGMKLQNFATHVRRQDLARFLAKYEIFKRALAVNGSVVECGVFAGGGLFTWYHLSATLEPYNHTARIIGFDTFSGFPSIHAADSRTGTSEHLAVGAFAAHQGIKQELEALAALHDRNRPLGHLPKIELVEGDATKSIEAYLEAHPHLLIRLMYLDFDLYEPTKAALDLLLPRVVKGGIVAFDELNCPEFPGETTALLEKMDLAKVRLERTNIDPWISYFVRE